MTEEPDEPVTLASEDAVPSSAGTDGDRPPAAPLPAAAASVADGIDHSLDPRSVALGRTIGWIVTAAISLGSLLGVAIGLIVRSRTIWTAAAVAVTWAGANAALAW